MNRAELQKKAEPQFEKLGVNKLYGTSDGQLFLLSSRAHLHAGSKLSVYALTKDEGNKPADSESEGPEFTVAQIKEHIKEEKDLEKIKSMMLDEVSGPNRKSAVAAFEKRIEELATAVESSNSSEDTLKAIASEEDVEKLKIQLEAAMGQEGTEELSKAIEARLAELNPNNKEA